MQVRLGFAETARELRIGLGRTFGVPSTHIVDGRLMVPGSVAELMPDRFTVKHPLPDEQVQEIFSHKHQYLREYQRRQWPTIERESRVDPCIKPGAEAAAYVSFTSGSTGRPKGVAVPHRAIVRLVCGATWKQG